MAYYNKVGVVITRRAYNAFFEMLDRDYDFLYEATDPLYETVFDDYNDIQFFNDDTVYMYWDWTKWDSRDIVVKKFMAFLDYLEKVDEPYHFIRIGEGDGTNTDIDDRIYLGKISTLDFEKNEKRHFTKMHWETKITLEK